FVARADVRRRLLFFLWHRTASRVPPLPRGDCNGRAEIHFFNRLYLVPNAPLNGGLYAEPAPPRAGGRTTARDVARAPAVNVIAPNRNRPLQWPAWPTQARRPGSSPAP